MIRFLRRPLFVRRYFVSPRRPEPRVQNLQKPESVELVYPSKPPWTRTLRAGLIYSFSAYIWFWVVLAFLDDGLGEDEKEELKKGAAEDAEKRKGDHDDVLWIPFLPKPSIRKKQTLASTPDETGVRTKGEEEYQQLGNELFKVASAVVKHNSHFFKQTGNPITSAVVRTAPDYFTEVAWDCVQSGLEIGNGSVSVVERQLSPEEATRLLRTFDPFITARALYHAEKLCFESWKQLENETESSDAGSADTASLPLPSRENSSQKGQERESPTPMGTKETSSRLESYFPSIERWARSAPESVSRYVVDNNPGIRRVFTYCFFKCLEKERDKIYVPPRGSYPMNGDIIFHGPRGRCELKVWGIYDPKTATWCEIQLESKGGPHFEKTLYNVKV